MYLCKRIDRSILIKISEGPANDVVIDDEFLVNGGGHEGSEAELVNAPRNAFCEIENANEGLVRKQHGGFENGDGKMMFDVGLSISEGEGLEGVADGDALIKCGVGSMFQQQFDPSTPLRTGWPMSKRDAKQTLSSWALTRMRRGSIKA